MSRLENVRARWNDSLSRIPWEEFERRVADYYRAEGYRVDHIGTGARFAMSDGGIDLKLYRDAEYIVVQCKHWNAKQVTHNAVHELIGVMHTEGANRAIVITSGEFTDAAVSAAVKFPAVMLISGEDIRAMLGPIPEPEVPPLSFAAAPPWMSGTWRQRKNVSPSIGRLIFQLAGPIVIALGAYLYIRHVLGEFVVPPVPAAGQTVSDRQPIARAPAVQVGIRSPPASSAHSENYSLKTHLSPAITTPDGRPAATGSTPSTKEEAAEWERENAKSMKILEKTTPSL